MGMPSLPGGGSESGWFKKPENRVAAFFIVAGFALAIYFLGAILPFVLGVFAMTIEALWHGAIIATALWLMFGERPRIAWRLINRWITSWFASLDPIGIRKDHIAKTEDRKREADDAIGSVRGLREGLAKRLGLNHTEYRKYYNNVVYAKKILNNPSAPPEDRHKADRCMATDGKYVTDLEPLIASQQAQLSRYDDSITKLQHLSEFCDDVIARKQREIRIEQDNQTEARSLKKLRGAMSAIFGNAGGVEQEMDDMAREQLEQEYSEEMGQFDQFMANVTNLVASNDFSNMAAMNALSEKLDKVESAPVPQKAPLALPAPSATIITRVPATEKEGYYR